MSEHLNKIEFAGVVQAVMPAITRGKNGTPVQVVHVSEDGEKYPQSLAVDFVGEKNVAKSADLRAGDRVILSLNVRAREYRGRLFNSISCWNCELVTQRATEQPSAPQDEPPTTADLSAARAEDNEGGQDEMPF